MQVSRERELELEIQSLTRENDRLGRATNNYRTNENLNRYQNISINESLARMHQELDSILIPDPEGTFPKVRVRE